MKVNHNAIFHALLGASLAFTCFSCALTSRSADDSARIREIRSATNSLMPQNEFEKEQHQVISDKLLELESPSLYSNWFIRYYVYINLAMLATALLLARNKETLPNKTYFTPKPLNQNEK